MENATPMFSIIVPTYDRAHMLPGALQTVKNQTFQDYEVLIIDDGSRDDTPRIIQDWIKDPRFKYHRLEHNIGNMYCRNLALSMARGEWVTNIDSDDFWVPERLEEFVKFSRARPQAGFLFSNGYLYRYGRIVGMAFDPDRPVPEGKVPGHYAVGEEYLPYLTTNLAIPNALYRKHGHYRRDMVILDNELYARMLAAGVQVGVIRKPLAVRRIHEGQVTHKWIEEYPESLEALKAGGASPEIFSIEKEKLVLEIANYLWRNLQPRQARQFMEQELGPKAKFFFLYKKTFAPIFLLTLSKRIRQGYLMFRHHPLWASEDIRRVYQIINPLMEREKRSKCYIHSQRSY